MKRRVLLGLMVIFLIALFSGCGTTVDEISTAGVPPDTTPPVVLTTNPTGTNVPVNTVISVGFSEPVANVNSFTFTVVSSTGVPINGTLTTGSTVIFTPDADLQYNTTYTVTVSASVTDFAGNPLAGGASWSFTTGGAADTTPPAVFSTSPTGTNVPADTTVTATFSELVNCATITSTSFYVTDSSGAVAGNVSCVGTGVTFTPTLPLLNNTTYTATLTTTVTDLAGNHLAAAKVWTFTTVPSTAVTTSTLPPATEGGAYSTTLSASGGTPPLSWSAAGLPLSLGLNASTGVISGTLDTGTSLASPHSIDVTVTDAVGVIASTTLSLTVNPGPSIASPSAGSTFVVTENTRFTLPVVASGGTGTLTWSANGLPAGLSVSPSTGLNSSITGTVAALAAGATGSADYSVGLTVTDVNLVSSATTTITVTVLATVTGVAAVPVAAGTIDVSWTPLTAATSYTIYYSIATPVTTAASSVTSAASPASVTGLTSGVPYYFAVSAVYPAGPSGLSAESSAIAP